MAHCVGKQNKKNVVIWNCKDAENIVQLQFIDKKETVQEHDWACISFETQHHDMHAIIYHLNDK